MALLNYTTTIAVDKTMGEIMGLLSRQGARSLLVDYDGQGNPTALSFLIETPAGERGFKLPANVEGVFKTLTRQYERGQVRRGFVTREQASRVGWRILKDWIEAQLAIIQAGMVTLEQVMLPYLQVDQSGRTLYEAYVGNQRALPSGRAESGRS